MIASHRKSGALRGLGPRCPTLSPRASDIAGRATPEFDSLAQTTSATSCHTTSIALRSPFGRRKRRTHPIDAAGRTSTVAPQVAHAACVSSSLPLTTASRSRSAQLGHRATQRDRSSGPRTMAWGAILIWFACPLWCPRSLEEVPRFRRHLRLPDQLACLHTPTAPYLGYHKP